MEMVKTFLLMTAVGGFAAAANFSLTIGPPVAAGTGNTVTKTKGASFAVRLEECADMSKAQLTAAAEGSVNGVRKSVPVMPASVSPGIYVVSQNWDFTGAWVVSLSATCGSAKAGAVVPIGPQGFVRDEVRMFQRPPSAQEIDAAIKVRLNQAR